VIIMLRRIVIIGIVLAALIGNVSALGMPNVDFGQVEQGKTYIQTATVVTSPGGFDNDLKAGDTKDITATLTVPEDARLGEYNGSLKAVGQKTAPMAGEPAGGTGVGYTIATKSKLRANVIKPGAVEAVSILSIIAPKRVEPDSTVRLDVALKNTGNIPTTASPTLTISKGAEAVATIPGVAMELKVDEEKTAKLYWDAQEEGTYTAVVTVTCGETTTTSDPIRIEVGGGASAFVAVAAILAVVIVILAAFVLLRRRRKG
jgi:uncharacterized membrane protein